MPLNRQLLDFALATDTGLRRETNEDRLLIDRPPRVGTLLDDTGVLFAVADGMGGHACGEVASQVVCQTLQGALHQVEARPEDYRRRLEERFRTADARLKSQGAADPECAHMGTTLSVLAVGAGFAVIAHVGDSRIYRWRGGRLRLLTTDHTFVQEMIAEGELAPEAAARHPLRNVLTRVLGTFEPLEAVDTLTVDLAPDDRFLLSSDGLHDALSTGELAALLAVKEGPRAVVDRLLALALARGGRDNISMIAVDVRDAGI